MFNLAADPFQKHLTMHQACSRIKYHLSNNLKFKILADLIYQNNLVTPEIAFRLALVKQTCCDIKMTPGEISQTFLLLKEMSG